MSEISNRKRDHIKIVLENDVEPTSSSFDKYDWPYNALPDCDMQDITVATKFFNWDISFPFLVSSMTGGEEFGRKINENIATACNTEKIPFGLGSMRVMIKHPETLHTFNVKEFAPNVPMFANVGLVQLNYGFGVTEVLRIIESVGADGLFIHTNHLQEAVQPEGDVNFKGLLPKLKELLKHITVPVVVKEVGHGIDYETAMRLKDVGISAIDVSGTGGTSWSWIEGYRHPQYSPETNLGYLTRSLGIPTDKALIECRKVPEMKLIAGGGVRDGLHIAKALCLGADYATAAKPFLAAAMESSEAVRAVIQKLKKELIVTMFAAGVKNLAELKQLKLTQKSIV